MLYRNEADVPKMVTEQRKWVDGKDLFFELSCETRHQGPSPLTNHHSPGFEYFISFTL